MQSPKQNNKLEQLDESISHIYSNKHLTFNDLIEIIKSAASGTLEQVTEKIDGSNLLFTYNNELRIARSNKDMLYGGLTPKDISERYTKFTHVRDAFINAFHVLNSALSLMDDTTKQQIFENGTKYYSIEVVYYNADHVINYDGNHIVFHEYPIYKIKNGVVTTINSDIELLSSQIRKIQSAITNKNWKLHEPCVIHMKNIANGTILTQVLQKIDSLLQELDLSYNSTIEDFLFARAKLFCEQQHISSNIIPQIASRMINIPGSANILQLKRLAKRFDEEIDELLSKDTSKKLIFPLELIITEFASKILQTITPTLPSNIIDTKEKLRSIIQQLRNNDYVADTFTFKSHLAKVGDIDNMIPIEGIVFKYKNQHYKFTGQFASANQLINLFRKTIQTT